MFLLTPGTKFASNFRCICVPSINKQRRYSPIYTRSFVIKISQEVTIGFYSQFGSLIGDRPQVNGF